MYDLFVKNTSFSKLGLFIVTPYYEVRYALLTIRDKIKTEELINNCDKIFKYNEESHKSNFKWNKEYGEVDKYAAKLANNNEFKFDNNIFYIDEAIDKYYNRNSK